MFGFGQNGAVQKARFSSYTRSAGGPVASGWESCVGTRPPASAGRVCSRHTFLQRTVAHRVFARRPVARVHGAEQQESRVEARKRNRKGALRSNRYGASERS